MSSRYLYIHCPTDFTTCSQPWRSHRLCMTRCIKDPIFMKTYVEIHIVKCFLPSNKFFNFAIPWFSRQSPTKVVGFPANSSIVYFYIVKHFTFTLFTFTATAWIWRSVKLSPPPTPGATRCCTKSPPPGRRASQIPGVCPGVW